MEKLSYDLYFMAMSFLVAQRSFDPNTKCGCVLVSKDNRILSTGYNGPIKNSNDKNIPLTRPDKYYHFIHSEMNALLAYNGSHYDIQESKAYITNRPCHNCLRSMLQKGVTEIYYSDTNNAKCVDEEDLKAQEIMLQDRPFIKITIIPYKDILAVLQLPINYICNKASKYE
jgi:dCMP deaminase